MERKKIVLKFSPKAKGRTKVFGEVDVNARDGFENVHKKD